jgi:N-acylglucosamine 2-epimerase
MNRDRLCSLYRTLLLDGIVPFWMHKGIDWSHGGVLSCMTEEGAPISGDKYMWSQARSVWTFSALYNRIEPRPDFLKIAENSIRFLVQHGQDENGDWVYETTCEGKVLQGAVSIYSDCFVVYGLSEYLRAVPDAGLLRLARSTYERIRERIQRPDFAETAPYRLPPGRRAHAIPMIMTEVSNELAQTIQDPAVERLADEYALQVMNYFVRPTRNLLVEFLSDTYEELPPPEGTFVMPGHAIESMWFVLHLARRRGNKQLARRAAELIRRHLEAGWDPEHGGIRLGIDTAGHQPFLAHSDKKLWWPHTEALYALLLADQMIGESWCMEWYSRVHDWAFSHFPMPETGEWRQRLDGAGNPTTETIALPVKDPFHLPRAAILITQLLSS